MNYEAPELVVLQPAINAIQNQKCGIGEDPSRDVSPAYEDWE